MDSSTRGAASTPEGGAASMAEPLGRGLEPGPSTLEEARARLAKVDELPVAERTQLLAAVNELIVAELAGLDEA